MTVPANLARLLEQNGSQPSVKRLVEQLTMDEEARYTLYGRVELAPFREAWRLRSQFDRTIIPPPFYGTDELLEKLDSTSAEFGLGHAVESADASFTILTDIELTELFGVIITPLTD